MSTQTDRQFDEVWIFLSEHDLADSIGGAQHARVLREWRAVDQNEHNVVRFIIDRANAI